MKTTIDNLRRMTGLAHTEILQQHPPITHHHNHHPGTYKTTTTTSTFSTTSFTTTMSTFLTSTSATASPPSLHSGTGEGKLLRFCHFRSDLDSAAADVFLWLIWRLTYITGFCFGFQVWRGSFLRTASILWTAWVPTAVQPVLPPPTPRRRQRRAGYASHPPSILYWTNISPLPPSTITELSPL